MVAGDQGHGEVMLRWLLACCIWTIVQVGRCGPLSTPTPCPPCPAAHGVVSLCNATHVTICTPCVEGTYSPGGYHHCEQCSRCGAGLYELHPCTHTADVFCEQCSSNQGRTGEEYTKKCLRQTTLEDADDVTRSGPDDLRNFTENASQNFEKDDQKIGEYITQSDTIGNSGVSSDNDTKSDKQSAKEGHSNAQSDKEKGSIAWSDKESDRNDQNQSEKMKPAALEQDEDTHNESQIMSNSPKNSNGTTKSAKGSTISSVLITVFACGFVFFLLGFFFTRLLYKPRQRNVLHSDAASGMESQEMSYVTRPWDYAGCTTPLLRHYNIDGSLYQSPVDILSSEVVYEDSLLKDELKLCYKQGQYTVTNTGTTVKMDADCHGSVVSGGPLGDAEYKLDHVHFHWGSCDAQGSEHTIDGSSFAGEVHFVHWNSADYSSFNDAVQSPDGMTVVATLIEVSGMVDNNDLTFITDALTHIRYKGESWDIPDHNYPMSLLPDNTRDYWTYKGALTAYSETVTWIIFKESIAISPRQMSAFRALASTSRDHNSDAVLQLADNFRRTQPLHDRTIFSSFF